MSSGPGTSPDDKTRHPGRRVSRDVWSQFGGNMEAAAFASSVQMEKDRHDQAFAKTFPSFTATRRQGDKY